MSKSKTQNALLIEIMIAVLFFALCSTILLETFVTAREQSKRAGGDGRALIFAEDLAERLYAAEDMSALLAAEGFLKAETGVWTKTNGEYAAAVTLEDEPARAGVLHSANIRVLRREQLVVELPAARYAPGEVAE